MAERCDSCRFWQVGSGYEEDVARGNGDTGYGWCRNQPPRIVEHVARMVMPGPRFGQQIEVEESVEATAVSEASIFPATFGSNWCGRYEAREATHA